MNARFVRECIAPDDRLVRRYVHARRRGDEPRRAGDFPRVETSRNAVQRTPRMQRHHDLLERGVAGTFADAVDSAFHLARAGANAGQRVGYRHAEVVVAVRRDHDAVGPRHGGPDAGDHRAVFVGRRVTHGVRNVERRRLGLDRDREHLVQEDRIRSSRILRRELDVLAAGAGVGDRLGHCVDHLLARHAQLVHEVDVRRRENDVNAPARRRLDRGRAAVDVVAFRARQSANDGTVRDADLFRDGGHGVPIAR